MEENVERKKTNHPLSLLHASPGVLSRPIFGSYGTDLDLALPMLTSRRVGRDSENGSPLCLRAIPTMRMQHVSRKRGCAKGPPEERDRGYPSTCVKSSCYHIRKKNRVPWRHSRCTRTEYVDMYSIMYLTCLCIRTEVSTILETCRAYNICKTYMKDYFLGKLNIPSLIRGLVVEFHCRVPFFHVHKISGVLEGTVFITQ